MDCSTARLLMPYAGLPAELPAAERALVERHLAECPACREAARRERQFDAAVARAMAAVEAPVGLRERIGVGLAEQRGRQVQRRAWQVAALAAAVLLALSVPLGWWASRVVIDPQQLAQVEDVQYVSVLENPSREAAEEFFRQRGLRTVLPADFDYRLLTNLDVVAFEGREVARLDFQRGPDRAKIYVLPRRDFRLTKGAADSAAGSRCTVEVVEGSKDFLYVIIYYGQANRQLFQPQGVVG